MSDVTEHEGKHLPPMIETRQGVSDRVAEVDAILERLREHDRADHERRLRQEASRRGSAYIVGSGAFWIGLLIALDAPVVATGSFALLAQLPGWPEVYGTTLALAGAVTVLFRSHLRWYTATAIVVTAVWYLAYSGALVFTWLAVWAGVIDSEVEPALYAGAVYFTLSLLSLKCWQSLREASRNRGS